MSGMLSNALAEAADVCDGTSALRQAAETKAREEIRELIESSPANIDVVRVFDLLADVGWATRWQLLDELGRGRMGLETMNQLELLYDASQHHPNLDSGLRAALLVTLFKLGGRTVTDEQAVLLIDLAPLVINLDGEVQFEILSHLIGDSQAAEGAIALLAAEAVDLGLTPFLELSSPIDVDMEPLEDITTMGAVMSALQLGNEAHRKIALFYEAAHPPPHFVRTNYYSCRSIIGKLAEMDQLFSAAPLDEPLARIKPDIFEYSFGKHGHPPGWIYEIKPHTLRALARAEVAMYHGALSLAGVPVLLGPTSVAGTRGRFPKGDGWVDFFAPEAGVITYQYVKASKNRRQKRAELRARQEAKERVASELQRVERALHGQASLPEYVFLGAILIVIVAGAVALTWPAWVALAAGSLIAIGAT